MYAIMTILTKVLLLPSNVKACEIRVFIPINNSLSGFLTLYGNNIVFTQKSQNLIDTSKKYMTRLSKITATFTLGLSLLSVHHSASAHANHHPAPSIWPNGTKAAVVLTYDDNLESQLANAVPELAQFNLPATFYISTQRNNFLERKNAWADVANAGHELGNHTQHHPCDASKANREWVAPEHDLSKYQIEDFVTELKAASNTLKAIDGKENRTFAYPCGDTMVGGIDVIDAIRPLFSGARMASNDNKGRTDPTENFDAFKIDAVDAGNLTAQEMIAYAEGALGKRQLVTFLFHGVGGDYASVNQEDHSALLRYLAANKKLYWVATMQEVMEYMQKRDSEH